MASPTDKLMKKQWLDINGRQNPVMLTQHWDAEAEDWTVTGTNNPFPSGMHFKNSGGVWVPISNSNPLPTDSAGLGGKLDNIDGKLGNTDVGNFPETYPDPDLKTEVQTLQGKVDDLTSKLDSVIKDGSLNTQLTGSMVSKGSVHSNEILMSRRVLDSSYDLINIIVPDGVSSGIVYLVIFGATGQFDSGKGAKIQVRPSRSPISNRPPIGVSTSSSTEKNSTLAVAIGGGFALEDSTPQNNKYDFKVVGTPIGSRIGFGVMISGEFESDEGIDCQVEVEWFN